MKPMLQCLSTIIPGLIARVQSADSRPENSACMDPNAKKSALRMLNYGLYVVTAATPGDRGAFLCNWLTQCSFDPPLVVMAVENQAHSLAVIRASGRFVVNVLETGQKDLASWFGRHSAKVGDKLANRLLMATPTGLPVLPEAL